MRIIKYKKSGKNTYQVQIEKDNYLFYDDLIIQHELLLKKELTKEELELLKKENQSYECYYQAIEYLNKKMRSEKEVREYLKEYTKEDIESSIQRLKKENYLNEKKYIESYINHQQIITTDGPNKIVQKLVSLGCDPSKVQYELSQIEEKVWQERCQKLVQKKIKSSRKDSKQMLQKKLTQYLYQKGYDLPMIQTIIDQFEIPTNPNQIQKEYQKLKLKLAKKYDGSALEYQIKLKLYQKGFTKEEIEMIEKKISY